MKTKVRKPSPKRRLDTRRLYKFEEVFSRHQPLLKMASVRALARLIWKQVAPEGKPLPGIVAGRGDKYNGRLYSYYDGERIVLARNERKKFVLIHELVHALGYGYHNSRFLEKYFELLVHFHRPLPMPEFVALSSFFLAPRTSR